MLTPVLLGLLAAGVGCIGTAVVTALVTEENSNAIPVIFIGGCAMLGLDMVILAIVGLVSLATG